MQAQTQAWEASLFSILKKDFDVGVSYVLCISLAHVILGEQTEKQQMSETQILCPQQMLRAGKQRNIYVVCSRLQWEDENREHFHYNLKKKVEEIVDELFTKNNLLLHFCPFVYIPCSLSYHFTLLQTLSTLSFFNIVFLTRFLRFLII